MNSCQGPEKVEEKGNRSGMRALLIAMKSAHVLGPSRKAVGYCGVSAVGCWARRAAWRWRSNSVWPRQYSNCCWRVMPASRCCTSSAPFRFISTQSKVLVFIFNHLQRRANLQRRTAVQDIHRIVEWHFLEMHDVPEIPTDDPIVIFPPSRPAWPRPCTQNRRSFANPRPAWASCLNRGRDSRRTFAA